MARNPDKIKDSTIITRFLGWDNEWEHIKAFLPKFIVDTLVFSH